MTNSNIADQLSLLGKMLDLHHQQQDFAKTLSNAAFQIDRLNTEIAVMPANNIARLRGVTTQIEQCIQELITTNQLQLLIDLIANTPEGILQMMNIKGLGPKKLRIVWQEMNIQNASELLYACNENRLIHYKGFGDKNQQTILAATEFYLNSSGKYLLAKVQYFAEQLQLYFTQLKKWQASITGDVRRQSNIVECVQYVIVGEANEIATQLDAQYFQEIVVQENYITCTSHQVKVGIYCCKANALAQTLFTTTGSAIFVDDFLAKYTIEHCTTEQEIFSKNNLPFISPIIREYPVQDALQLPQTDWIQFSDIKGIIHNHSTYSDGAHTLQEMANACVQGGYAYFVISDHSQYASYANGLHPEKIVQQHAEIDQLNQSMTPFKIFKSIECDILPDGSLDYTPDILNTFDIVIASVHSVLNMTQEKAMERLLKAIANPYTSILGHPTGRLLLGRAGYPLDMKIIIDACAQNNVAIELNANPRRLDIDWSWIGYAVQQNVLISINPDAHHVDGIADNKYGVLAAQKAGLLPSQNLSSFNLSSFTKFVHQQQQKRPNL
jgi:DNA polymerase (family X)